MNAQDAPNVGRIRSPIGSLTLVWSEQGLHGVYFPDAEEAGLKTRGNAIARTPFPLAFAAYFQGQLTALDTLPLVYSGTAFQERVWAALRRIPPGETRSYAELATTVGHARASRAVGTANGRNPLPIVVPCHRVIAAGGKLGGYGGGLERKRWLLCHEGAAFSET
jgi:methylated-DNA-[protein]-cysteine S-methyltransferase